MTSPATAPPWIADLTRAERRRLLVALGEAEAVWRLFWEEQSSCVRRICGGKEPPLQSLRDEAWEREYDEQAKPGKASARLAEAIEKLKRLEVPVPPCIHDAVSLGRLDIMVRNMPPVRRPDLLGNILDDIQERQRRGEEEFSALRAAWPTTAPRGQPGRKPRYPKTLALAVSLRQKKKGWKEIWGKCKKKAEQVGESLPGHDSFRRRVQAFIAENRK